MTAPELTRTVSPMAIRRCWHCDAIAHMTVRPKPVVVQQLPNGIFRLQATLQCDQCRWLQLAQGERTVQSGLAWDSGVETWFEVQTDLEWWPAIGISPPFEDVPQHIGDAATEAHRCYSIQAYRGATALARAVVEASAKDKKITKGTLFEKIEELEKNGHVRAYVREAAHEVRHLGNEVAHGDFVDPIEPEEAEEALALMGEVLQEVFQSPARVAAAKARREAKKAARAED